MHVDQFSENSQTGFDAPDISVVNHAPSLDDAFFGVEPTSDAADSFCESLAQCYRIARERARQFQVIEGKTLAEQQEEVKNRKGHSL